MASCSIYMTRERYADLGKYFVGKMIPVPGPCPPYGNPMSVKRERMLLLEHLTITGPYSQIMELRHCAFEAVKTPNECSAVRRFVDNMHGCSIRDAWKLTALWVSSRSSVQHRGKFHLHPTVVFETSRWCKTWPTQFEATGFAPTCARVTENHRGQGTSTDVGLTHTSGFASAKRRKCHWLR